MFAGTTHAAVRTACRGDAVRRPGTVVHAGPTSPNTSARVHRTPRATHRVAPTLPAGRVCSSSERTESCRLFPTKQQRDASPWQGEAGAQRRVRVDPVVVRPHHPNVPARHGPAGRPTGSPLHCVPVGCVACAWRGVRRFRSVHTMRVSTWRTGTVAPCPENDLMHVVAQHHLCITDITGRCRGGSGTAPTKG
jgi:hypothetical protein